MRRAFSIFIAAAALIAGFASCNRQSENDAPVTMLVTHGFGEKYFTSLAEDVKKDLGIDIEFLYTTSANRASLILQDFIHNGIKADIVFTSSKVPNQHLRGCCLDFVANSHLASRFSYNKLSEFMTEDGCVYQLPLSSKLIGITYNATLMKEKGWNLPRTFQDMVDLKQKCDAEGIPFAVTDINYTGAPFNYLFHIMGTQWLSTVKGTVWFEGFLEGTKTINVFKEKAQYFRKWTESGLFGDFAKQPYGTLSEFARRRALFCFSTLSDSEGYDGPQVDERGNPTGIMLHDVHKSMPWISNDGSNNCYTVYDNCWAMVDGSLAAENKKGKLEKVLKVLDYMMSEKYSKMAADLSKDVYLTFDNFQIGEDRTYSEFQDEVKKGFLQPWYYNNFSEGTIIGTGAEIGSYMVNACLKDKRKIEKIRNINYDFNPFANYDSAIGMLRNTLHSEDEDYLGWAEEDIEAPKIAEMVAISGGMSLQECLGDREEVSAALMPYASDIKDMQPWRIVSVQNVKAYPGALQKSYSFIFTPSSCEYVVGIWMNVEQIEGIIAQKYDPSSHFIDKATGKSSFDIKRYGPYPYVCVTKGGKKLERDEEFLVAVSPRTLEADVYKQFESEGKILKAAGGETITANLAHGIALYFDQHPTISNSNISWQQ